ncbi:MAG: hypothetical protein AVDCRST_MAG96-4162 [uncultured Segetibacter sp.]|uniref:Uncharacterized protein n=1 Tax=uncultured Segetibacter sp. TaxID=481133 RepID=A0A6J4U2X7_9BACT|nr:MAG: hypothetical protein AVDCRST_MAG96-4162 [uncultured Segetibacter sp.]
MTTTANEQIPKNWAQHTVEDSVNVSVENYRNHLFKLNLEGNWKCWK